MDVLRFEQDLAALSPDHQITALSVAGITPNFSGGYVGTWTAGVEHKVRGVTLNGAYVGTAGIKLPSVDFPNGFSGADPGFAPYTQFDSSGVATGGYGPVTEITNRSHSTYHALQLSAQNNLTASGLGFQASYTRSKSLDDTSAVVGGFIAGSSGAVAQTAPMNPFEPGVDKGPSGFDIKNAFTFSLFQDLHADSLGLLRPLGKTLTAAGRCWVSGLSSAASPSPSIRVCSKPESGRAAPTGPIRSESPTFRPAAPSAKTISGWEPTTPRSSPFRSMCPAEPDRITGASARSAETRFADRGCGMRISP